MLSRTYRTAALLGLVLAGAFAAACGEASPAPADGTAAPPKGEIILATTTSTQDSGLLDVLLPRFERRTGWKAKPIAVGSGQAMTMGRRGDADVLLEVAGRRLSAVAKAEAGARSASGSGRRTWS